MKIGLFGGSFDPVHAGHMAIASEACRLCHFNRFFFIPAYQSPFKQGEKPAGGLLRAEMLNAAFRSYSSFPFEIGLNELRKASPSYTIDTIREIKTIYPSAHLTWIGGDDLLPGLPRWKESEILKNEIGFLIFRRIGGKSPTVPDGFRIRFFDISPYPFSSSEIRHQIASGVPLSQIKGLLPAVVPIIEREGLYR